MLIAEIVHTLLNERNISYVKEDASKAININKENLKEVLILFKENHLTQFNILTDVFAVDYPNRANRFEVVYNLLSLKYNYRLIIKVNLNENESIPSIVEIYSAANWYEREAYDMYGIKFANHPDLRRILTDYEFEGYPLRKDFPLTGYVEVTYDSAQKKVIYEPVRLPQEFRNFDFFKSLEGTDYILPGDEKATK